jgi:quercetin dioxygenase-like cupin family protein
MRIVRVERGKAQPPANPEWFPGTVYQQRVNEPENDGGIEMIGVWFEPGSRTRPHVHPVDQVLNVLEGEGVVATEAEKWIIRPGDWVVVPAGVWHWHGATADTAMCHVSIKQPGETDWTAPWGDFDAYMDGASEPPA